MDPAKLWTELERDTSKAFNEDFLAKFIDNTVGHYSLKMFTIIVKSFLNRVDDNIPVNNDILSCRSKIGFKSRAEFIGELSRNNCELLHQMLGYRSELTTEEDRKLHKLFSFLLEKIYKLDPTGFKFIGA